MGRLGKIARRTFLLGTAALAGGVAVGYYFYKKPYDNPLEQTLAEGEVTFNPYIKVAADGTIVLIAPRAEMGQGVSTTLAALVAEELDVDLSNVRIEHGPADGAYYNEAMIVEGGPYSMFDHSFYANFQRKSSAVTAKFVALQATGGSSSVRDGFDKMRQAGAVARQLLLQAAAKRLGKPAGKLTTENGKVVDTVSGTSLTYGELASDAASIEPPDTIALKPRDQWKILGKSQPRIDMHAKSTGTAGFGIDVDLPDMLYGTVRMNPHIGGELKSFDDSKAKAMRGVVKIVRIDAGKLGQGIGVIADNTWRAFEAAKAVEVEWGDAPYPASTDAILDDYRAAMADGSSHALTDRGDAEGVVADTSSGALVEAEYSAPFLAHACMEPMNATARFKDGKLEIWAGSQAPNMYKLVGSRELDISSSDVTVHNTLLGGGFGRRGEGDFPLYAVKLAKEAGGRPVKVTWTREEDMTHDMYRPAALGRFKARVTKDGALNAVDARIAAPSITKSALDRTLPGAFMPFPDRLISEGAFDQPYGIENFRVQGVPVECEVPLGFWRSVGNSHNAFFQECFIDEVAHAAGQDPVAFRLALLKDHPVAAETVAKVAAMSGWDKPLGEGKGRGIAFTLSFGTYVAEVVQVSDAGDGIRIDKVWCAVDLGTALDPSIIEAQMQSGIVFGLSAALGQEITFADGMVEQTNFDTYDAMRIHQAPEIEVAILENSETIGGAGEPSTPPSVPALANAIFDLTGKRLRHMPLSKDVSFVT